MAAATKTSAASRAKEVLNGANNANNVEAQLEALKADVSKLTQALTEAGNERFKEAKSSAIEASEYASENAQQTIARLRGELETLDQKVSEQIRERPYQALGIAAGVGVLAALLLRK
ncbi:DUF883 family protein [Ahrensia kielensis]|uniref:DUF883 family protein n=1 Tax=Ahrensia kielensis TaxID=76980 RepID=A0ABU9T723_9HYPH|nr:DUF883 family protein [Ahrensia kielensis]